MLTDIKDINYFILNKLSDKDIVSVFITNKQNNKVNDDENFWFQRILSKFPCLKDIPIDTLNKCKNTRSWKNYYIVDLIKINYENKEIYLTRGAIYGYLDYITVALFFGVNIHFNSDLALKYASQYGHLDVVKYLVEKGANIHALNNLAIKEASGSGHLDVVKYLVEKGADMHDQDNATLRWASQFGRLNIVKFLVEECKINSGYDFALRLAIENYHHDVINYLKSLK